MTDREKLVELVFDTLKGYTGAATITVEDRFYTWTELWRVLEDALEADGYRIIGPEAARVRLAGSEPPGWSPRNPDRYVVELWVVPEEFGKIDVLLSDYRLIPDPHPEEAS